MSRDPRVDPRPGDVVQVRPWRTVHTRTVVEPDDDLSLASESVVFTSPTEPGRRTIMSLDQWQEESALPVEMSEEEQEGHRRFDVAMHHYRAASLLARSDGHHCLSCAGPEQRDRYFEEAQQLSEDQIFDLQKKVEEMRREEEEATGQEGA